MVQNIIDKQHSFRKKHLDSWETLTSSIWPLSHDTADIIHPVSCHPTRSVTLTASSWRWASGLSDSPPYAPCDITSINSRPSLCYFEEQFLRTFAKLHYILFVFLLWWIFGLSVTRIFFWEFVFEKLEIDDTMEKKTLYFFLNMGLSQHFLNKNRMF